MYYANLSLSSCGRRTESPVLLATLSHIRLLQRERIVAVGDGERSVLGANATSGTDRRLVRRNYWPVGNGDVAALRVDGAEDGGALTEPELGGCCP